MNNSFEMTRSYIVGRKVLLEKNLEELSTLKDKFETECITLMEKLDDIMKAGVDAYESEISKLALSVDLHQSMLVSLDEQSQISEITDIGLEARRELTNLETIIGLTDKRVKQLFASKSTSRQHAVVKTTIIEQKSEPVATKAIIETVPMTKKESIAATLFRDIKEDVFNETEYTRSNGAINNQFIAERLYEYLSQHENLAYRDLVDWISNKFPLAKDKWATIEKGTQNILSSLKRTQRIAQDKAFGSYYIHKEA